MPSSSLFLRSSTTLVSALSLISSASAYGGPSSATTYALDTSYSGDSFYTGWDFWSQADPTHGFVTYLDRNDAQAAGLLRRGPSGSNIIGVDSTNTYDYNVSYYGVNGLGRPSVRISSQKTWNHGLFIADIANMPGGVCGTWPAFWTLGDGTWPYHGEIDILEGANNQQNVLTSLHTAGACSIAGSGETGSLQATNCTYDVATGANSAGCGVSDPDTSSYGLNFNKNRGGVYAMEWTSQAIKIWFWPRSSIPSNVLSGTPDTSTWGLPDANFAGSCDIDSNFQNHQIVVDNTFCGDWAGNTWGDSCQAATGVSTCAQYVGENPSAFASMYWDINAINVYTSASVSSTTTSSCTTTTSSYTIPTASTTVSTTLVQTTRPPYTTPTLSLSSTSQYTPPVSPSSAGYSRPSSSTTVPYQDTTWSSTSQSSSASVSSPLTSGWPQGSLVGVPMGGGVDITRTVSGHGFSKPTNTESTGASVVTGSSTAWYEGDPSSSASGSVASSSSYSTAWNEWDPSSSASGSVASSSSYSTAWNEWDPSSSASSSVASSSSYSTAWNEWDPSVTSSTSTSTVTLSSVWPDWDSSSSSSYSISSSTTTTTSSWADWTQSSTVTISVSTVTVSPLESSSIPASATYGAWSSGSSSNVSPTATASATYGADAWSSAASPASYSATSASPWVATYTGAASSNHGITAAVYTIVMALGILAVVL